MGRIEVNPDQVTDVGNAVVRIADRVAPLGRPLGGGGGVAQPPLTGAALRSLAGAWRAGTERLAGDVRSLGQAAQGAAFLYRMTDAKVIPPTPP